MNDRTSRFGMRISTRLFLSFVAVLIIAVVVAFIASEAVTPLMMRLHRQHHRGPMMWDMAVEYETVTQRSMLLGLVAGLLVAAALSIWLSRRITAPLRAMHRVSERIAGGYYAERLDDTAPGEVGELAAAFNRMAGELHATEARRSSLIGNVAHEFRTPLTGLQGYIEGIADGHFRPDSEVIASCTRQLARLRSLVDDLSLLSRVEAGVEPVEPRAVGLATLLEQAHKDLIARFEENQISLTVEPVRSRGRPADGGEVLADPDRTLQVIENLLTNALRHTPAGGTVTLSADRDSSDRAVVSVADNGAGIPEDAVPYIFERFYRADTSRARRADDIGTGIGLTVSKAYVEAQGGEIWVQSTSREGTIMQFSIPSV